MAGIQHAVNVNYQQRSHYDQIVQSICQVIVLKKLLTATRTPRSPSGKRLVNHIRQYGVARMQQLTDTPPLEEN